MDSRKFKMQCQEILIIVHNSAEFSETLPNSDGDDDNLHSYISKNKIIILKLTKCVQ